ncbi:putative gon7 family protein [Erysiphe neolycopersici]|uniref:EKC/KEOPS complex subunit GON7 n=1 Tax=Erysiphe neolycopersici TaxID=212602 RepID=A0A420HJ26_9PEZI|nr:putative gon7 family protein [Erysiphe neolycopersici]
MSSTTPSQSITAVYTSPSESTFACTKALSLNTSPSTEEKKIYLSALKKAIAQMQEEINVELTKRMGNDTAISRHAGTEDTYQSMD